MNSRKRRALVFQGFMITAGTFGGNAFSGVAGAGFMDVGVGLAAINTLSGYYPFANILWNGDKWERNTGTGAFSQDYGQLTAAVSTDRFRCKLAETPGAAANLPSGTYTVLNPDGLKIGIGAYGDQNRAPFTNATSFTFDFDNVGLLCLHVEGSVTNINGPIRIIMPGQLAAFQSGNPWNPVFLNFIAGLNLKCLRFMDWLSTNNSLIEDWADAPTSNNITFRSKQTRMDSVASLVSYSLIVDLCNRLNIDPWLNIPTRATNNYVDGLASYLSANLNANRKAYFELGNETWNPGQGFADNNSWVARYQHTRYTADVNYGVNGWTAPNHGLTNGQLIYIFFSRENFGIVDTINSGFGQNRIVEVIDANTFRLRDGSLAGAIVPPNAYTVKLMYKKDVEAGKTVSVDLNYGAASKAIWDRLNTTFPRARSVHVMGTQLVSTASTAARLSPTGAMAASDMVAVAHYYQGDWWVGCVDVASGQLTPKAWSRNSGGSVRVAVYAAGSTPTMAQVMAGSGTGYVGHRDITITATDSSTYTAASAITGLTNGTTYAIRCVLTGQGGYKWMSSGNATVSATPSTVAVYDSDDNMAKRAKKDIVDFLSPFIASQQIAAGTKPVVAYECGSDYFGGNVSLAEVKAWRTAWTQTESAAGVLDHFYRTMAAKGMTLMNHFVDVNGSPGVFNVVESLTDTLDPRYIKFAGYQGKVPKAPFLSVADRIPANIAVEPSYPSVVDTFPNAALTYSIFNGDDKGNYAIVGNQLRIVNGGGIDWLTPNPRTLTIEASDGILTDYFTVSFATGDAWYQSDAIMAWSALIDTDSTAIDPTLGNPLPLLNGTAATNSGGLLTFDATKRYGSTTGLLTTVNRNIPFLIAVVMDKNGNNTDTRNHVYTGTGTYVTLQNGASADNTRIRFAGYAGSATFDNRYTTTGATPAGKHVHWFYYDGAGTIRVGLNQVENTASALAATFTGNVGRDLYIGGSSGGASSLSKVGAVQHVNRAGMSFANALAIVQKMQTLHGI